MDCHPRPWLLLLDMEPVIVQIWYAFAHAAHLGHSLFPFVNSKVNGNPLEQSSSSSLVDVLPIQIFCPETYYLFP